MAPKLQIALDTFDLPSALGPLQKAAPHVDIVECGTILVLCEGYRAFYEHSTLALRAIGMLISAGRPASDIMNPTVASSLRLTHSMSAGKQQ